MIYLCFLFFERSKMQAKNQFSRRQIRIKIFQLVYGLGPEFDAKGYDFRAHFKKSTQNTELSFAALSLFILKVFDYSLIHSNKESSKYIQENIKTVDTDIARLPFVDKLKNNQSFTQTIKDFALQNVFENDLIKKTYFKLIETEEFKAFVADKENPQWLENLILRAAEYAIDGEEQASEFFDERYINWEDDIEVIQRWLTLLIKQPNKIVFQNTLTDEKIDFAEEVLSTYFSKQELINERIQPKLKNWDSERVALVDLILLRLGMAELLFFPEIPIKVSINEYIDIAKMYSTEQSGQFVNGVLDNIRKDLEKEGALRKHS